MRANQPELCTDRLTLSYPDQAPIAENLDIRIAAHQITALIGANGSGKSTILKSLARLLKPSAGTVLLDGKDIHSLPSKQVAQRLGMLPQLSEAPQGLTVGELVGYGRFPYQNSYGRVSDRDREMIQWALSSTGLTDLQHKALDHLSGGQRQRAWIAMAIAQDTDYLLLDEPTTYLDIAYQIEVLDIVKNLNEKSSKTIIAVLHDLNHAAQYADHIIAISAGHIHSEGAAETVITPIMMREVFGVEADIILHERTGRPTCIPYALSQTQRP